MSIFGTRLNYLVLFFLLFVFNLAFTSNNISVLVNYDLYLNCQYDSIIKKNIFVDKNLLNPDQLAASDLESALVLLKSRDLINAQKLVRNIELRTASFYQDNNLSSLYYYVKAYYSLLNNGNRTEFFYKKSLASFDRSDPLFIEVLLSYSDFLIENSFSDRGRDYINIALKILESYHKNDTYLKTKIHLQNAFYLYSVGKLKESLEIYEFDIQAKLKGNSSRWSKYLVSESLRLEAYSNFALGKYKKVLRNHEDYVKIVLKIFSKKYFRLERIYFRNYECYFKMGNYELALDFLKKSVLVSGTSQGYSQRINSAYRIAYLKYKNGNYHECIEIGEKSLNLNSNNLRSTIYNSRFLWLIAQSEFGIGKVVEANSTIDLCIELREKLSKQNEYFVLTAIDVKLKYLLKLGKLKEAQALFNTTIRKFPLDRIIDYPKLLEFYVDYCEDLIENDFLRQANDILGNIADWLEWNKQVESRKHYELKKLYDYSY